MSCINDQDLDLHPPRKRTGQKLTDSNIESAWSVQESYCQSILRKHYKLHFFSDEKIFKLKQFDNSHNDVVYVQKKLRKVHVPEERLFSKTEVFLKQIMLSVGISKADKTSIFFVEPNTKVNVKCYLMYYCRKWFLK